MYQETFSSASLTDSEISTEALQRDISNLQSRIDKQSCLVEEFLGKGRNAQKDSEAYQLLSSLFSLFKIELNMNKELRSAIINERKQRRRTELDTTSMYAFFKELSRISGDDICSFEDAVNAFISVKKRNNGHKKGLSRENAELQDANAELRSKNAKLQMKVSRIKKRANEEENSFERISTKFEALEKTKEKYRIDLNEANRIIKEQEECISCMKKRFQVFNEAIDSLKEENSDLKGEIINLQGEKKSAAKDAEIAVKEVEMRKESAEKENSELKQTIKALQEEISREKDNSQQISEFLERSESEKNELLIRAEETDKTIDKACKKIIKLKKKNQTLKDNMEEALEASTSEITKVKERTKDKFNKDIDKMLNKQRKEFESVLRQLQKENKCYKLKSQELEAELERFCEDSKHLKEVIVSSEERTAKVRKAVSEYKEENERLRNLMRQQSAEQSENEKINNAMSRIKVLLNVKSDSPSYLVEKIEKLIASDKEKLDSE